MDKPNATGALPWRLASEEPELASLFDADQPVHRHVGIGAYRGLEFFEVNAKRIINRLPPNTTMPFGYTINAYRGCAHGCHYCFARPTHAYLGFGIGADFDRRIVVKVNAVERARGELGSKRWRRASIAMGTNTDPYQKAEGKYHLTRGLIEVLTEVGNPFSILTKSTLVLRDLELLQLAHERTEVMLNLSIGTLDREVWRLTEPGTPSPEQRIEAVRRLNASGVPCGVLIAPVLPGLSDDASHLEAIATACRDVGAVSIGAIALHLRPGVRENYLDFLGAARPDLLELYRRRFAAGAYQAKAEQQRISATVARIVGESRPAYARRVPHPYAPPVSTQLELFESPVTAPSRGR